MDSVSTIKCDKCPELVFDLPSSLKNHIKRDHQTSVNTKYRSGLTIVIEREADGKFMYTCGRSYGFSGAIRRHTKDCDGGNSGDTSVSGSTASATVMESRVMEESETSVNDLETEDVRLNCAGTFPLDSGPTNFTHHRGRRIAGNWLLH